MELSGSGYHGLTAFTTKIIDGHPSILLYFRDIDGNSSVRIWRPYNGKLLDAILEVPDVDIDCSTISRDSSMLVLVTRADALARGQMEEMVTIYLFDKDTYFGKLALK